MFLSGGHFSFMNVVGKPDSWLRFFTSGIQGIVLFTALLIMIIWGSFSEFLVDLNGNGKLWLFIENWYNPVFITINDNGLTIIPQLIWFVAPIIYYFTVLKCLSKKI